MSHLIRRWHQVVFGPKRTSLWFGGKQRVAFDPLQKWGRGERPYAEHRSNMNVINISAKKSELDLAR